MKTIFVIPVVISVIFYSCSGTTEADEKDKSDKNSEMKKSESEVTPKEKGKKEILFEKLIGKHSLENISGTMGANSMIDIYKENGQWIFSGSSNEGGVREGWDNEFTSKQIEKLNTIYVEVKEDLTVILSCKDKTYLEIPFSENGMVMSVKPDREYVKFDVFPQEISSENGFHNGVYYLLADDHFDEEFLKPLDVADLISPDFALLTISEKGEISLNLRWGDCCDNYFYTFK
jgi:hypothetical protein